jgi:hypothetical protein
MMEPLQVWSEFIQKLRDGSFTEGDCKPINGICFGYFITRPDQEEFRKRILGSGPPTYEYGEDKLIFKLDEGKKSVVRFDFVTEGSRWYLYFIDSLTIPIKAIDSLPFSEFPALEPWRESFGRTEDIISFKVKVYKRVAEDKGKEEALAWFKDGMSFRVCSSAWLPYFSPPKAFVLLVGWKDSRLYGENVIIEELSDGRSVILYKDHTWFKMYRVAAQFKSQITFDEYNLSLRDSSLKFMEG